MPRTLVLLSRIEDTITQDPPSKTGWSLFWSITLQITIGLGLIFHFWVVLPKLAYNLIGIGLLIGVGGCFILSKLMIPGGYSLHKQAICHMGRIKTKKGAKNYKAALFIGFFFLCKTYLIILLGNLIAKSANEFGSYQILPYLCYFSAIFCLMTGLVPIDLFEKFHIKCAFTYLISINIWLIYLGFFLWNHGFSTIGMNINTILLLATAIGYFSGYAKEYRYTAALQKLWVFFEMVAIYLGIYYFSL